MHPTRTVLLLTATLALTTALSGCLGGGDVEIYVKDAPTDEFESVFITFSKVAVHEGDEGEAEEGGGEPDTEGAGWTTVFEGTEEIDLLAFSEPDQKALLGEEGLSAGTYNQIVITVDSARGIKTDGSEIDIEVTTGWVRVVRAFEISDGGTTQVTIDFDLDRSLVDQGPRGWSLNPVVGQVTVEEA